MSNDFYNGGTFPSTGSAATSASMRAEFASVTAGFAKLPTMSGNGSKVVVVNSTGTALEAKSTLDSFSVKDNGFTIVDETDITKAVKFQISGITTATTRTLTPPNADTTLVGTDVTQTLTNKTLNLTSNTLSGTVAQFNTALSDGDFATLAGSETLTNKKLTSPCIGTSILDTNGNELFLLTATASAVNELTYANAATGNAPAFTASGGDANISINLVPKGSGTVRAGGVDVVTTSGTQTLTNKTYNGLSLTAAATGFTVAGGTTSKTLTVSNTLTLAGTDGATINVGAGGTLGSAAFTASTAYEPAITTLAVSKGGTGAGTFTANNVLLGNGTGSFQVVSPGTAGNVLSSNGTTWVSSAPSGASTSANNAFTGANTFYNGTGQTFGTATSTNDGIIIAGRAGGTLSYRVTLTPGTLTASRAVSFPDAAGTLVLDTAAQTLTNKTIAFASNTLTGVMAQGATTIYVPASAMTARTTNGAASGTAETTTNKVMLKTLDFDAATAEYAQFSVRMPKNWDEGTVTAYFLWSNASGTGNVVWGIQGLARSDTDALDTAFGTAVTVTDAASANNLLQSTVTGAITIGGTPAEADLVIFQVYRDAASGSDTLAVDARLHGVVVIYTTNAANDA